MTMRPGPNTASKVRSRAPSWYGGPMSLDERVPSAPRMPAAAPVGSADGRESPGCRSLGTLSVVSGALPYRQPQRTLPQFGACGLRKLVESRMVREVRPNALPPAAKRSLNLRALSYRGRAAKGAAPITKSRATVQEASLALQKVYEKYSLRR